MTQDEIIAHLQQETRIQENNTVKNIYKQKSRSDTRESSTYIGVIGTGALGALTFLIILSDLPRLVRHLKAALSGIKVDENYKKRKMNFGYTRGSRWLARRPSCK